ncbi:hypothetical protein [Streptomyces sioyaensis]|uniref:hypothetical protein n=1 Tax=Streptomyces sioyaensis TaxID=67364 RepID=UPI001F3C4B16|nr:hypothetical protein [Streptomyces sioyaensis]
MPAVDDRNSAATGVPYAISPTPARLDRLGQDTLIQIGLDALLAGVDSESLAVPAGLGCNEELKAPDLFERVLFEPVLEVEVPADPRAARWALACWIAGQCAISSPVHAARTRHRLVCSLREFTLGEGRVDSTEQHA